MCRGARITVILLGSESCSAMPGGKLARLGQLESVIMDRLWRWDRPVSVRDVLEDLQHERSIAYTTVMTVLDNLHRKGMVLREKAGRAYVYKPTRSSAMYTAELMEQALSTTADRGTALLRFVEQMSGSELDELRQALRSMSSERPGHGAK